MTAAGLFWLLIVLSILFPFIPSEGRWAPWGIYGRPLLELVLFGLLGWAVFGVPLHR